VNERLFGARDLVADLGGRLGTIRRGRHVSGRDRNGNRVELPRWEYQVTWLDGGIAYRIDQDDLRAASLLERIAWASRDQDDDDRSETDGRTPSARKRAEAERIAAAAASLRGHIPSALLARNDPELVVGIVSQLLATVTKAPTAAQIRNAIRQVWPRPGRMAILVIAVRLEVERRMLATVASQLRAALSATPSSTDDDIEGKQ